MTERRRFGKPKPDRFIRDACFTIKAGPDKGKTIEAGTFVRFFGEESQYKFLEAVLNPRSGSEWVTVIGGPPGRSKDGPVLDMRSFNTDLEFLVMNEKEVKQWKRTT